MKITAETPMLVDFFLTGLSEKSHSRRPVRMRSGIDFGNVLELQLA